MPGTKPSKGELAQMKVLSDAGNSPNAIARRIGRDRKTVAKYLQSDVFQNEDIKYLVALLKEKEIEDLILISGKTRAALNNYLDQVLEGEKQPNPIAIVAIQDRCFTQRQLLEGRPTQINIHSVIEQIDRDRQALQAQLDELDGVEGEEDE